MKKSTGAILALTLLGIGSAISPASSTPATSATPPPAPVAQAAPAAAPTPRIEVVVAPVQAGEYTRIGNGWNQPCRNEDGPAPCFFNADHRGGDHGMSFHFDKAGKQFTPFRDVEGHDGCWIHAADTSIIRCDDGFRATS